MPVNDQLQSKTPSSNSSVNNKSNEPNTLNTPNTVNEPINHNLQAQQLNRQKYQDQRQKKQDQRKEMATGTAKTATGATAQAAGISLQAAGRGAEKVGGAIGQGAGTVGGGAIGGAVGAIGGGISGAVAGSAAGGVGAIPGFIAGVGGGAATGAKTGSQIGGSIGREAGRLPGRVAKGSGKAMSKAGKAIKRKGINQVKNAAINAGDKIPKSISDVKDLAKKEGGRWILSIAWTPPLIFFIAPLLLAYGIIAMAIPTLNWPRLGQDNALGSALGGGRINFNPQFAELAELGILIIYSLLWAIVALAMFWLIQRVVNFGWHDVWNIFKAGVNRLNNGEGTGSLYDNGEPIF